MRKKFNWPVIFTFCLASVAVLFPSGKVHFNAKGLVQQAPPATAEMEILDAAKPRLDPVNVFTESPRMPRRIDAMVKVSGIQAKASMGTPVAIAA